MFQLNAVGQMDQGLETASTIHFPSLRQVGFCYGTPLGTQVFLVSKQMTN